MADDNPLSVTPTLLTPDEQTELERCEAVVRRSLLLFIEVGEALLSIQQKHLYRATHGDNFDGYLHDRFDLSSRRVRQLTAGVKVVQNLLPPSVAEPGSATLVERVKIATKAGVVLPTSERQTRPLASKSPEVQVEKWNESVEVAGGGQPSTQVVEAVVKQDKPPAPPPAAVDHSYRYILKSFSQQTGSGTLSVVLKGEDWFNRVVAFIESGGQ